MSASANDSFAPRLPRRWASRRSGSPASAVSGASWPGRLGSRGHGWRTTRASTTSLTWPPSSARSCT
jgi:hypothetical protein